jgi:hypothetical protein
MTLHRAGQNALQHILTATAINLVRLNDWWTAMPHAKTRVSHFAALAQAA